MMNRVLLEQMTDRHLEALARSLLEAPEDERDSPKEILQLIKAGTSQLFETPDGLYLCRKVGNLLWLDALCCYEQVAGVRETCNRFATFLEDLRQLAADWQCDKIKTCAFDSRITSVIQHLGGRVESWTLTLALE